MALVADDNESTAKAQCFAQNLDRPANMTSRPEPLATYGAGAAISFASGVAPRVGLTAAAASVAIDPEPARAPELAAAELASTEFNETKSGPLVAANPVDLGDYQWSGRFKHQRAKRALDFIGALLGLICLAPLLILLCLAVKLDSPGPALYAQRRVTAFGRPFWCLKLRTMVSDADARLEALLANDPRAAVEWRTHRKLSNDPRVTALGRFLRKSSLDELPQLINVLKGEMSLVGPRPIVPEELPLYGLDAIHYLRVRPGITGAWQVHGRSDTDYRRRVALDRAYSRGRTFVGDLAILMLTIPKVFAQQGAR